MTLVNIRSSILGVVLNIQFYLTRSVGTLHVDSSGAVTLWLTIWLTFYASDFLPMLKKMLSCCVQKIKEHT